MPSCFLHTNLVHHGLFHSNLYAICTNIKCIHFSFSQWFFRSALINFYFLLHAAEKEANFLRSCNRCWAVCLLYWQYFLNVCRIIVHQQAVLFFFFSFFASAAKHTNIVTFTWQEMKDVFNPSIHEVYLGTMCCLQDQTCWFHCFILRNISVSLVCC